MIGADLILAQVDIAKDFSLSSNAGQPDSASTNLVRACWGRRRAMRKVVLWIDSICLMTEGQAMVIAMLPYSRIGRMHAL